MAMRSSDATATTTDSILENLKTSVVCLDADLRIIHLNTASEVLFNVSARYCTGVAIERALPCLSAQRPRLLAAVADGAAFTQHELRLEARAADTLTVDCSVTPFIDAAGRPALLLEFLSLDRQLRISRDQQMRNQNLANREMIRGLAHEIKNPLGGLRGAAQLLERELDADRFTEFTAVIIREADRLQALVDDMLGPRQPPDRQPLNIHEPLEHVRCLIEAECPGGIRVRRDYDPSIPPVAADRGQLIQILFNLMGNALAALGDQGTIELRTRTRRRFTIGGVQHRLVAHVDIVDDGPGIAPDLLAHIFLPMVSSRAEGGGMGLPIAQYLSHLHDGLIECESRPGRTVFSLFLPLEVDDG